MTDRYHRIKFKGRDDLVIDLESNECVLWPLAPNQVSGYGYRTVRSGGERKVLLAHRYVYELVTGTIDERPLDHLCRVKLCVNPNHLEQVTVAVNNERARPYRRVKTMCDHGHDLTLPNALVSYGNMKCRECRKDAARRYRETHRDKVNAYRRAWRKRASLDPAV